MLREENGSLPTMNKKKFQERERERTRNNQVKILVLKKVLSQIKRKIHQMTLTEEWKWQNNKPVNLKIYQNKLSNLMKRKKRDWKKWSESQENVSSKGLRYWQLEYQNDEREKENRTENK